MEIKCEKCGAVADSVLPKTYLDGEIELTFFRCPECGEVYPMCQGQGAEGGYRGIRPDSGDDKKETCEGVVHPGCRGSETEECKYLKRWRSAIPIYSRYTDRNHIE